jgi:hypothetical protein
MDVKTCSILRNTGIIVSEEPWMMSCSTSCNYQSQRETTNEWSGIAVQWLIEYPNNRGHNLESEVIEVHTARSRKSRRSMGLNLYKKSDAAAHFHSLLSSFSVFS